MGWLHFGIPVDGSFRRLVSFLNMLNKSFFIAMKKDTNLFILFIGLLLCLNLPEAIANDGFHKESGFVIGMASAVNNTLAGLTPDQKKTACVEFSDPVRFNWHYIPRERKGISLKNMSPEQRKMSMDLLRLVLSKEGATKSQQIIDLENVLRIIEKRPPNDTYRDPENYSFLFYGLPGKDPWGWRFEGHHLSLQFTVVDGVVAFTPGFMGSNPGQVLADVPEKGLRILAEEQDVAFELLNSFNEDQLQKALLDVKAPNDILTTNTRKVDLKQMEGISMKELTTKQKNIFKKLIQIYLHRYHVTLKQQQWEALEKGGTDQIHFVWMGDKKPVIGEGHGHYYRIHGPTILIEFDNTQNGGNHIHSVVRDLTNDFGEDLLRAHYAKDHR